MTLAERRARKVDRMRFALGPIDEGLRAYARHGRGRFIRFGSSATGRMGPESDVDLIADFPDERASLEACSFGEGLCSTHGLRADIHPAQWMSDGFVQRAEAEGIVLA